MWSSIRTFFEEDLWKVSTKSLPLPRAFLIRFLRVFMLMVRGFRRSQIQQGASYLTYYSLLALVPTIAFLIGIARGFNLDDSFYAWLSSHFEKQSVILTHLFNYAEISLQQARQGLIAGLGIFLLLWAAIKILNNIEYLMNEIWEIHHSRTLARKCCDFLALLIICPVILILSNTLTVYLSAYLITLRKESELIVTISPFLFFILKWLPYLLSASLFIFLYVFIPNTNVKLRPAIIAGLVTGILYQLIQWFYLSFQIGISSYNGIYGTFAALPLFLIWLHFSWVIFLLGAKMTFAIQNVDAYEFITEDFHLNRKFYRLLCLRIVHLCVHQFCEGQEPLSKSVISQRLKIPLALTKQLLNDLVEAKVLNEIEIENTENVYQPAIDVEKLTIKRIIDMIDEKGETIPLILSSESKALLNSLETFDALIEKSEANIPLKNLKDPQ